MSQNYKIKADQPHPVPHKIRHNTKKAATKYDYSLFVSYL